jgi:hypothetical protein
LLPAIKDNYTASDEDSLFETSRFEGNHSFRNGILGNQIAIYLFIIVAASIYPAVTLRGLRGMSVIAFVYTSILVYVIAADKTESLKIGWYVIYAGIILMFAARQIDIWQNGGVDPLQKYRAEYAASRPGGTPGLIGRLSAMPLSADPKKPVWSGSAVLSSLTPSGVCVNITSSVLSVRQGPSGDAEKLVQINSDRSYDVLGKSADGQWWLIDYGGGQGWISVPYTQVMSGNPNSAPVIE